VPDLVRDLLEGRGARGAGIVHHDVDLAEGVHRLVVGAADIRSDTYIGHDAGDPLFRRPADRAHSLIQRLAPASDDGNVGSRGGKPRCHCKPYPLAASGDDGSPASQIDLHQSHSIILSQGNAFIEQRKFLLNIPKNRLLDTSEIRALEFKGEIRRFGICSVLATINIDRSIFHRHSRKPSRYAAAGGPNQVVTASRRPT
jgi:hypothetical protein